MSEILSDEMIASIREEAAIDKEKGHSQTCINIEDLNNALSELQSLREREEWRTIETAPKDGTDILTWDGNDYYVLFFSQYGTDWTCGDPKIDHEPTHWKPITPPSGDKP